VPDSHPLPRHHEAGAPALALTRRTLLTGALLGAGTLITGCAGSSRPAAGASAAPSGSSTAARPSATATTAAPGSRTLLAYFSRAGENYYYGGRRNLQVGNTEVVARMIEELAAVDVFRIEPARPYPTDYEQTVELNRQEQADYVMPELAQAPPALDGYDTVLLGSPVWSSAAPRIMWSFLEAVDLSGKTLLPFVTHAVSGLNRIPEAYGDALPDTTIGDGLAIQGETAGEARPQVQQWLSSARLLR
jgi:flavodoxin